ncbi:hypothetical protein Taro_055954 [Colocasia esculenta]|uniref:Uncharacterized protein n=1 Tax=Colocasia esculenta TaxID=4460 RepID=A0A843XVU1_COLES|nr:hypothetical protein [Colocasia esculenta]
MVGGARSGSSSGRSSRGRGLFQASVSGSSSVPPPVAAGPSSIPPPVAAGSVVGPSSISIDEHRPSKLILF